MAENDKFLRTSYSLYVLTTALVIPKFRPVAQETGIMGINAVMALNKMWLSMSLFSRNSVLFDKSCEISENQQKFVSMNIKTDGYTDGRGHHRDLFYLLRKEG